MYCNSIVSSLDAVLLTAAILRTAILNMPPQHIHVNPIYDILYFRLIQGNSNFLFGL